MLKFSRPHTHRPALAALAIVLLASTADAQSPVALPAPTAPKAAPQDREATPLQDAPRAAAKPAPSRNRRAPKPQSKPKAAAPAEAPGAEYLGSEKPLTPQERAGLAIANKWRASASAGAVPPVAGADGAVVFAFGSTAPNVVCAVFEVCDVELQAGEQVNSINVGDAARWLVTPAISGQAPNEIQHLVIKPVDVGLSTSLIITTDRRTYHLTLISRREEFMPRVAFSYPADVAAQWANLKLHVAQQAAVEQARVARDTAVPGARAANGSQEYLANLRFNYTISGEANWKPVRVFNDGVKTVIEMPTTLSQGDAPTLLVVRKGGNVSNDADTTLVNYRVQDGRYIVDQVFDEAVLVVGVGNKQQRVTIVRGS